MANNLLHRVRKWQYRELYPGAAQRTQPVDREMAAFEQRREQGQQQRSPPYTVPTRGRPPGRNDSRANEIRAPEGPVRAIREPTRPGGHVRASARPVGQQVRAPGDPDPVRAPGLAGPIGPPPGFAVPIAPLNPFVAHGFNLMLQAADCMALAGQPTIISFALGDKLVSITRPQ
jgi:hypothetical protein